MSSGNMQLSGKKQLISPPKVNFVSCSRTFYRLDALYAAQPTASKHVRVSLVTLLHSNQTTVTI